MGCDENGKIMGVCAKVVTDTGAFASLGGPGAFRGFGVTQTCFATETLNMMADKVGITPWEIRWRNAIRPNGVLPKRADLLMILQDLWKHWRQLNRIMMRRWRQDFR